MIVVLSIIGAVVGFLIVWAVEVHLDDASHDEHFPSFADIPAEHPDADRILPLIRAREQVTA